MLDYSVFLECMDRFLSCTVSLFIQCNMLFSPLDCHKEITTPDLPGQSGLLSCEVSGCTRVDCCMNAPLIGRGIHTFLHIEECSFKMTVGIERLSVVIDLTNYDWGKFETIY